MLLRNSVEVEPSVLGGNRLVEDLVVPAGEIDSSNWPFVSCLVQFMSTMPIRAASTKG